MMAWFGNRLLSWLAPIALRLRGVKGGALAGFHEKLGSPQLSPGVGLNEICSSSKECHPGPLHAEFVSASAASMFFNQRPDVELARRHIGSLVVPQL